MAMESGTTVAWMFQMDKSRVVVVVRVVPVVPVFAVVSSGVLRATVALVLGSREKITAGEGAREGARATVTCPGCGVNLGR